MGSIYNSYLLGYNILRGAVSWPEPHVSTPTQLLSAPFKLDTNGFLISFKLSFFKKTIKVSMKL